MRHSARRWLVLRAVPGTPVRTWWPIVRATWAFPAGARGGAWRAARQVALERWADEASLDTDRAIVPGFGELIARRRCWVCASDDIALDGWVPVGGHLVCADCSRAALAGTLAYGRLAATYRGRVGSPRRALGEVYQAVVSFKEHRGDWAQFAGPLARALARS